MAQLDDRAWRRFSSHAKDNGFIKPLLLVAVLFAGVLSIFLFAGQDSAFVFQQAEEGLVEVLSRDAQTDTVHEPDQEDQDAQDESPTPAPSSIVVHIDGAVERPGVYELLDADMRVDDLVVAAGGLLPDADTKNINLAAKINDGMKIYIPLVGEEAPAISTSALSSAELVAAPTLININVADKNQLMTLPGIGESTAEAIIVDREQNGSFSTCEDLMRVSGIGEKKYSKLEGLICV